MGLANKTVAVPRTAKEEYPHKNPEHTIFIKRGEASKRVIIAFKIPQTRQAIRLAANMLIALFPFRCESSLSWQNLSTVPKAEVTVTRIPIHIFPP